MSGETLDLKISLIKDPLIRGAAGKTLWRYWASITLFEKRYALRGHFFSAIVLREISSLCVLGSFSERYWVMEIHNASSKTLLCYGQFLGTLLRYWRS